VRNDYRLDLTFADGVCGTVDLSDLAGRGVFALWNDYAEFQKVQIGERGELTWGNQLDLCPDSLYLRATGKNPGDIFPLLKCEPTRA
jgi:hypothetical protein